MNYYVGENPDFFFDGAIPDKCMVLSLNPEFTLFL